MPTETSLPDHGGETATVLRVSDGDTIEVRTGAGTITVRLDGINAPDSGECYHQEAATELRRTLLNETVIIETRGNDQFGRTLALVWHDDLMINLELVGSGYAIATTPLLPGMSSAENSAYREGLGLWGSEACGTGPIPTIEIDFARSVVDPPGPDNIDQEVLYIRNPSSEPVDLTAWVLRDESSRHRYHFKNGTMLAAGTAIGVRSSDPGWDPGGSAVWNNDGDIIILLDPHGRVVSMHRY